jgi:Ni/Fe-hydrogenase subunit HybB-like protein
MNLWPNFKSPLLWDVFAVSTYFTVSLLFWYVGLIPDLATLRDRAKNACCEAQCTAPLAISAGAARTARHWQNYERAYLILAALSTPLVLSVHSVVSFDFATSVEPGWHTTIFPPYFVAGAVFSGFAMVHDAPAAARACSACRPRDAEPPRADEQDHPRDGQIVGYAYAMEFFIAWYSGNPYERFASSTARSGPYAWAYWTMISCNVLSPQLFWFKKLRTSIPLMFIVSIFVNIGMWFERFVIIVTSLHRDFLPSAWGYFRPTLVDILTYVGTLGLFFTLFLLFIRWVPMIAIAEVKGRSPRPPTRRHAHDEHHDDHGHAEPAVAKEA